MQVRGKSSELKGDVITIRNGKRSLWTTKKRRRWPWVAAVLLLTLALLAGGTAVFFRQAYPLKYDEWIRKYSQENDVPVDLVYAVIRTESSFRPDAQSNIGAKGLMQITEPTLDWIRFRMGETGAVSYEILYDPQENIRYGTYLLRLLLEEFGSQETALAAYHAGRGQVLQWLSDSQYSADSKTIDTIPFADTSHYVSKVLRARNIYKQLYQL